MRNQPFDCDVCEDSRRMPLSERMVPCNRCPVPCKRCRDGAYCRATPCRCACHEPASATDEAGPVTAPVAHRVELDGDGLAELCDLLERLEYEIDLAAPQVARVRQLLGVEGRSATVGATP